jgi:hypothetical protein
MSAESRRIKSVLLILFLDSVISFANSFKLPLSVERDLSVQTRRGFRTPPTSKLIPPKLQHIQQIP